MIPSHPKLSIKPKKFGFLLCSIASALSVTLMSLRSRASIPVSFTQVVLSPDGKSIASAHFDREVKKSHIEIFSTNGSMLENRIVDGVITHPSWDGISKNLFLERWATFFPETTSRREICFFDRDSGGIYSIFSNEKIGSRHPFLHDPLTSPDGVHLSFTQTVFVSSASPTVYVCIRDVTNQSQWALKPYIEDPYSTIVWSGDGSVVCFRGAQENISPKEGFDPSSENNGLVWATAKDEFIPHFFKTTFSYVQPNSDGNRFALITGKDEQGSQHLLRVVDTAGTEIAKLKRESISVNVAWNSTNTAIFFLDNFYTRRLQLCRWDIKTGQVDVLQPLDGLRGKILGYRNGTVFYSTAAWDEKNSCQINQFKSD